MPHKLERKYKFAKRNIKEIKRYMNIKQPLNEIKDVLIGAKQVVNTAMINISVTAEMKTITT